MAVIQLKVVLSFGTCGWTLWTLLASVWAELVITVLTETDSCTALEDKGKGSLYFPDVCVVLHESENRRLMELGLPVRCIL